MRKAMSQSSTSASDRLHPGCLVRIIPGPYHCPSARINAGKIGIVIKRMTEIDGVVSSPNVWQVMIGGKLVSLHALNIIPTANE